MTEVILGKGNRIGRRMILLIILFSSLITLLITLTQLFFDYRQQRSELDQVLDTVAVHVPVISASVWSLDRQQTELALRALVQMPNIERASVIIRKPERQWMAGVNQLSKRTIKREYPLMHHVRGQEQEIANLEVVASLDAVYFSVAKHALVIFLSNGLKTFIVAIFMFFAFQRVVTGRLERLAGKVVSLVPGDAEPAVAAGSQKPGHDELDMLDLAFEGMNVRLKGTLEELNRSNSDLRRENAERRRIEEELKNYQKNLEEQVRERAAQIVLQKEQLQETLTELQLVVENASLGIVKVEQLPDGSRCIRQCNRAFAAMLGYPPEELVGRDTRTFYIRNRNDAIDSAYRDTLVQGRAYRSEQRLVRSNGELVDVWVVGIAIDPQNLSRGTLWLLDDITARKRVEKVLAEAKEAAEIALWQRENALSELKRTHAMLRETQGELVEREKLAALGALVAGVAHELETPIGNALVSATTLSERQEEVDRQFKEGMKRSSLAAFLEAVGESSQIVVRSMQRAAKLVESFRRVAVDQTSSLRRRFRLDENVAEIIMLLQPLVKKTPYVINCRIPEEIEMDSFPGPLGQVLTNLLNNALVHAFDGCDHGTISVEASMPDDEHVEISVRDNGVGIAKTNIGHIFEPFFSTRFGQGGSGLGLSIVSNLVAGVLGGKISVDSEEGQGSVFTLVLPITAPELPSGSARNACQPESET